MDEPRYYFHLGMVEGVGGGQRLHNEVGEESRPKPWKHNKGVHSTLLL